MVGKSTIEAGVVVGDWLVVNAVPVDVGDSPVVDVVPADVDWLVAEEEWVVSTVIPSLVVEEGWLVLGAVELCGVVVAAPDTPDTNMDSRNSPKGRTRRIPVKLGILEET